MEIVFVGESTVHNNPNSISSVLYFGQNVARQQHGDILFWKASNKVAKCTWCLILSLVSNLIVFVIYTVLSLVLPQGAASLPSMFATALALTLVSSWIIPATLFLTMRVGTLSGIFIPLAAQLLLSFSWSLVPLWPVCPPTATIVLPTAFLPVLPTGEPASDGLALVESIAQTGNIVLALIVAGVVTTLIAVAGATWLARSEELR